MTFFVYKILFRLFDRNQEIIEPQAFVIYNKANNKGKVYS